MEFPFSYVQLFGLTIGIGITFIIAALMNKLLSKNIDKLLSDKPSLATTYSYGRRLVVAIVILIGVSVTAFTVFPELGGLASSVLITVGFLSIVVGMAAQQSISNLIAGFLVSTSRPIEINDAVVFHDEFCFVEDILLMHSVLRTWDNKRLIVPNSTILSEVIINYSKTDPTMLAPVFITITYESNLDKAMNIMVEEAKRHPDCLPIGDLPNVAVMDYSDRGIELRLLSRAKDQLTAFMMIRDLLYAIKKKFDQEGINIAPSRTYLTFDERTREQIINLIHQNLQKKDRYRAR